MLMQVQADGRPSTTGVAGVDNSCIGNIHQHMTAKD
jgi:hypothetical protein